MNPNEEFFLWKCWDDNLFVSTVSMKYKMLGIVCDKRTIVCGTITNTVTNINRVVKCVLSLQNFVLIFGIFGFSMKCSSKNHPKATKLNYVISLYVHAYIQSVCVCLYVSVCIFASSLSTISKLYLHYFPYMKCTQRPWFDFKLAKRVFSPSARVLCKQVSARARCTPVFLCVLWARSYSFRSVRPSERAYNAICSHNNTS